MKQHLLIVLLFVIVIGIAGFYGQRAKKRNIDAAIYSQMEIDKVTITMLTNQIRDLEEEIKTLKEKK